MKKCMKMSKKMMAAAAMAAMAMMIAAGAAGHMMGKKSGWMQGCKMTAALIIGSISQQEISPDKFEAPCANTQAEMK